MREYHYKCKMVGRCKYAYFSSYTTNKINTAMFARHNAASIRHLEKVWLHSLTHTHTLTWAETELTCTTLKIHKALHEILQVK